MWKKTYKHLKSKGFKVYSPGQHQGICNESYIVLRDGGGNRVAGSYKLGWSVIDVIIYHPQDKYSSLGDYVESIKTAMKEIKELKFTGLQTPGLIEEDKQAHTTSLQYQILKRL